MNSKIFFSFVAMCLSTFAFAQEASQKIDAPVQSVIIYLDGAEIYQSKNVSLNPGRTKLIFTGISSKLISKSIQVTATGDVNILAVSDKLDYSGINKDSPRIKGMKDSLKLFNEMNSQLMMDRDAFELEKKMLISNQSIGGNDKGVAIAELKLAADFYRSRVKEINSEILKIEQRMGKHNEIIGRLSNNLNEENGLINPPAAEITVLVNTALKTNSNIELKYIVSDAGWSPAYDLKAEDNNKPIELVYRAKVYNNTFIDWKNVKIKLSTGDPMKSASQPQLQSWYLNFQNDLANAYDYQIRGSRNNEVQVYIDGAQSSLSQQNMMNAAPASAEKMQYEQNYKALAQKLAVTLEEIQVSELSAEFDIKNEYTIPSDAKPYIVEVTSYNLPATYKYFSVPKIEKNAFMLARISGWEDLELVEGPANVYLGGTFVGQSYIYTRSTNDTLDLSVGRDNKIMVTRTKLKDFSNEKLIGNNRKITHAYEIAIKNNRKGAVTIDIEDQLPVSQSSEISVESIELSKGELDPLSGKIKWSLNIQPGETKKINLTYSVKYPRNKSIMLEKKIRRTKAKF